MSAYDWHPQQQQRQQQQQQQQQQFVVEETHLHEVKGAGKRSRQTYSKYQTAVLETVFQTSRYIVRNKRQQMSAELSLTERQIKIWFQNRRMKEKKCHKEAPRIVVERHVQQPRVQGECCPPAALAAGYAEDYCNNAVEPADDPRDDDVFAGGYHPAVTKHRPDDGGGYAVYGGYDLLTATTDPYDQRVAKQQCWSAPVDFHQDLYGDLDSSHFQRLSTNHHHYPLNSQVQDYCPPQLQAAHGY